MTKIMSMTIGGGGASGGSENRAGSGGNGNGRQQSTKSSKHGGDSNRGGQEAPGKRREAGVVVGAVAAAGAVARAVAAAGAAAAAAMASGERPEVRVEIEVPCTLLGDYLAQSRAMFVVSAYLERSQCLASRQTFICAADRFICLRRWEIGHFYVYLHIFLKIS